MSLNTYILETPWRQSKRLREDDPTKPWTLCLHLPDFPITTNPRKFPGNDVNYDSHSNSRFAKKKRVPAAVTVKTILTTSFKMSWDTL